MAALVQTFPQETATITMLQTRPNSATGRMPNGQQTIPQYGSASQAPRTFNSAAISGYRGTPVHQYAFQSTPSLKQWEPQTSHRVSDRDSTSQRHRFPTQSQMATGSRDDSALQQGRPSTRPQAQAQAQAPVSPKATPDRYRRGSGGQHARSQSASIPMTNSLPATTQFYNVGNAPRTTVLNRPTSFYATVPASMDDLHLQSKPEQVNLNNMRRRSVQGIDSAAPLPTQGEPASIPAAADKQLKAVRTGSYNSGHSRSGSSESGHSRTSSGTRGAAVEETPSATKSDQTKPSPVPARASYADAIKRTLSPSPLSRSGTVADDAEDTTAPASGPKPESLAVQQLAAIQKGGRAKSKTSRLRRAFSFGSAAELRKAAGGPVDPIIPPETAAPKAGKELGVDGEYDAEQARIAAAQEAGGIGSSIYGGRFFGGSTDNLSISSTASSASIMIRKMGRGMKKSSRSLAGLFRPKSVVGVPPPDNVAPEGSVSMVTAEAETQKVNVTAKPQPTDAFPHLERISLDANRVPEMHHERTNSSETDSSRRSIVGGDRERAEVLAAVRKGILKRTGSSSPSIRPADGASNLPTVPAISDSPNSSAPSTPNDEVQGHRRTGSVAIGSEDYFMSALRLRQDSKSSTPGTPNGVIKRNATFSPRLVFHETWPSQEYDRRGEISTCNRLTPMLAQQIKEELNTLKMEMEVHENSKIYTHFF
ncbi:hypothetical protein GMORB2_2157 [Geosmithia morbida]|uniref:Protein BNI4 n=1 Tax=Geosmithia morbida TaxID=1094350 RepID=A0A9P4YSD8_9HYPO|nr:uncharacterized protein GMORB2_2157 [Geosmithia morbida]KAF4121195.1 hypothetical protein GMORB2_2157 [Geosmithia morbida]